MSCTGSSCGCAGGDCRSGAIDSALTGPGASFRGAATRVLPPLVADIDMSSRSRTTVLAASAWPPQWWAADQDSPDEKPTVVSEPCPVCGVSEGASSFVFEVKFEPSDDEKKDEKDRRKKAKEDEKEERDRREGRVRDKVRRLKPGEGELPPKPPDPPDPEKSGGGDGSDEVLVPKDRARYEKQLADAKDSALEDAMQDLKKGSCPDQKCPDCELFSVEFSVPPARLTGGACCAALGLQEVFCTITLKCTAAEKVVA